MPGQLDYVLHPASFHIGWKILISRVPPDDPNMYYKTCSHRRPIQDFTVKKII